ncbi:MAG: hypothetical protein WDO14_13850 [Bacteroidota bacterium]
MIRLTSRLTFVYRFIAPMVIAFIWISLITMLFIPSLGLTPHWAPIVFFPPLFYLIPFLVFRRLRDVYFDIYGMKIFDGSKLVAEVPLSDIVSVDSYFSTMYKIRLKCRRDIKTYLVQPKVTETFMTLGAGVEPSIKTLQRMISKQRAA